MRTGTQARGRWVLVGLAAAWLGTAFEVGASRAPVEVADVIANARGPRPASREASEGLRPPPARPEKRGIRPPWREPWIPEMRKQAEKSRKLTA